MNSLSNDKTIRKLFYSLHKQDIPKSPTTISLIIIIKIANYYKNKLTNMFNKLKPSKFGLYSDEWTDYRGNRFMGFVISPKEKYFNLGLIKLAGTLTGERIFIYLQKHLKKFHLDIQKDISVIITDGASNMVKMSSFFKGPQILCFAYFLHLVVGCSLDINRAIKS